MNQLPPNSYSVVYHDLPISTYSGWDRAQQIEGMIVQHDMGMLRSSAIFCDSLTRDDRINGVLETRTGSLLATKLECRAANESAAARKLADVVGGDEEAGAPGMWESIFPLSVVSGLIHWGNLCGIGIAEIIWDTKGKSAEGKPRYNPRLKLWHPQFLYWDWQKFCWMLIAQEGVIALPNINENVHSDGKWVIYTPHGYQYGWLRGLLRPLAYKYMMRGWNYRDWARYNERHGQPIIGVITPPDADEKVKQDLMDSVVGGGSDAVIALPQDSTEGGQKYDIKLIEAVSRSFDSFKLFKGELDTDIAVTVLGQNLTTEVKGGSRAAAEIQNQVRIDKRRQDGAIARVFRDQVLWWDAGFNSDDPELAPIPAYQVEPPADETEEGNAMKALGDGAAALDAADPGLVNVREIYEVRGIPVFTEEEVAANKAVALEEAQKQMEASGGPPGGPGGAPGGGGGGGRPFGGPPKPGASQAAHGDAKKKLSADGSHAPASATPVMRRAFQGLTVAIENPAGTMRVWCEPGPIGSNMGTTKMLHDYGYIEGAIGNDKEELDAYLGPDEDAPDVHVVHQKKAPDFTAYDEDKVFLGFADAGAAKAAFLAHRSDDVRAFGSMSTIPLDEFKRKLRVRTSTGKIRASSLQDHRETTDALIALARRAPSKKARTPAGARRAMRHPDQLEERGIKLAARALAGDLEGLKSDIDSSTSFQDLRRRVIERYKGMRPEVLADVVRRVNLMATMSGRIDALKQI